MKTLEISKGMFVIKNNNYCDYKLTIFLINNECIKWIVVLKQLVNLTIKR